MRRWSVGIAAAAICAAGAHGQEDPAAAEGAPVAVGGVCELPRVADRSQVSSLRCIACHDGSSGPAVPFEMGRGAPGESMSHPVEVDYAEARLRQGDRYVPEALLPADVPLVAGKVACTSCHDGSSGLAKRVVDPARLCYACHRL